MEALSTVALIDDDEDLCKVIAEMLRSLGIPCDAYTRCDLFLESVSERVGLIMLDMQMPAISGLEVLALLGARGLSVPIILMSGADARVLVTACTLARRLGLTVVGQLQKPFRLAELQRSVEKGMQLIPKVARYLPPSRQIISDGALVEALDRRQFTVHYQPQLFLKTGHIAALEVLARWDHPDHGLIFPENFISRFENLGLIERLDRIVCGQALSELGLLREAHGSNIGLSINISVRSLLNNNYSAALLSAREHGFGDLDLTLELTCKDVVTELSSIRAVLASLREGGVRLSLVGFGSEVLTVPDIQLVSATNLKINRLITELVAFDSAENILAQKIIQLAHSLNLRVVAEGVETNEQRSILRAQGCDLGQGYLFGGPLPLQEMLVWLKSSRNKPSD